jgi:Pyridine nucleotide-disulphide oxidoreductase
VTLSKVYVRALVQFAYVWDCPPALPTRWLFSSTFSLRLIFVPYRYVGQFDQARRTVVGAKAVVSAPVEVAVVGAGPYGLSLAAHLDSAGIQTRIFGRPMDSWRSHMPEGMLLKSDPFASNLSDPQDFYTLARFSEEQSIPYSESEPVKLDVFCNYGLAFQKRCLPELTEAQVSTIEGSGSEFIIGLDTGGKVRARRVVIAVGVGPFRHMPEILAALPDRFVSHSFDHRNLSLFAGARLAVIGGGSSAIDLAGLLHERGCDVTLISRRKELRFTGRGSRQSGPDPWWRGMRHPPSGLGPGLRSRFSTDAPLLIHALPKELRSEFVRRHLGPAASKLMKDKVVGRVPLLLERELVAAAVKDSRVALTLRKKDGLQETLHVDHVIAATGFRVDLDCLTLLSPSLRKAVASYRGAPILTRNFESSARGLYFIGLTAAASFGPLMRFTFGARYAARRLTRALVKSERVSPRSFAGSTLDGHAGTPV